MFLNYANILLFFAVALLISAVIVCLPLVVSRILKTNKPYKDKLSPYECGFDPEGDARPRKFDVKFYLVAILFVIFDLEIALLFPWAVSVKQLGIFGFCNVMLFLGVLTLGFVYEWRKGALDWT
jgi:NADH-quinone oxidoreductase subunit A